MEKEQSVAVCSDIFEQKVSRNSWKENNTSSSYLLMISCKLGTGPCINICHLIQFSNQHNEVGTIIDSVLQARITTLMYWFPE